MGKDSLTKSTTKKKAAAKKKKEPAAEKAVATKAAAPAPKPSLRELLHKKFETAAPASLYKPPAPADKARDFSAPPFFETSDPQEAQRVRALMAQKFSLADLEAAAKARAQEEARLKAEAEARAKAEEEARLKAEAEAKAKAEEEARLKAEAEARAKAEEEARLKAEAEAKAKAEEEARLKAEAEAKAKAEEEARLKAEAEAKAKAEEEARLKAEAEAKAKAEEEARIQAEAKRLAAERAASRQAAIASEPQVSVTYGNDAKPVAATPVDKTAQYTMMGLAGGIAFLFLLIILASISNTGKFYLKPDEKGLAIWQGRFAPVGTRQALFLPGVAGPEAIARVYSRSEVMPFAVNYFLAQADAILAAKGIPDFEGVKRQLTTALEYATQKSEKDAIAARLNGIDRAILLYKAEVEATRQSAEGYDEAVKTYRQALGLAESEADIQAIEARIAAAAAARDEIKARLAQEAAAAEAKPAP